MFKTKVWCVRLVYRIFIRHFSFSLSAVERCSSRMINSGFYFDKMSFSPLFVWKFASIFPGLEIKQFWLSPDRCMMNHWLSRRPMLFLGIQFLQTVSSSVRPNNNSRDSPVFPTVGCWQFELGVAIHQTTLHCNYSFEIHQLCSSWLSWTFYFWGVLF